MFNSFTSRERTSLGFPSDRDGLNSNWGWRERTGGGMNNNWGPDDSSWGFDFIGAFVLKVVVVDAFEDEFN